MLPIIPYPVLDIYCLRMQSNMFCTASTDACSRSTGMVRSVRAELVP